MPVANRTELFGESMGEDAAVLTIEVQRQDSSDKPFLVSESSDLAGNPVGNMFGYFLPEGDATPPIPVGYIHALMRNGLRPVEFEPAPTHANALDSVDARLEEDLRNDGITDEAYLWVQAWVDSGEIADLQEEFREVFRAPPQLRPSGFNIDFYADEEHLKGGGLRKVNRWRASLSATSSCLTTLVVVEKYQPWGMEKYRSRLINPYPLVEFIIESSHSPAGSIAPYDTSCHQAVMPDRPSPISTGICSSPTGVTFARFGEATADRQARHYPAQVRFIAVIGDGGDRRRR